MFLTQLIVLFLITFRSAVAPYPPYNGYEAQGAPVPSSYSQGSYNPTQPSMSPGMSSSPTSAAPSYSQPHHLQTQHQPTTPQQSFGTTNSSPPSYSSEPAYAGHPAHLQSGHSPSSPTSYAPTPPSSAGAYNPSAEYSQYSPITPQSPHTGGQNGIAPQQSQFYAPGTNQAQVPVLNNNYVPPPLPTDPRNADLGFIREE